VATGNGDPEVSELRSVQGYSWTTLSPGVINTEAWSSRLGVGLTLTTSPRKKIFVENLLNKILEEANAHIWAVVPLMMMMIYIIYPFICSNFSDGISLFAFKNYTGTSKFPFRALFTSLWAKSLYNWRSFTLMHPSSCPYLVPRLESFQSKGCNASVKASLIADERSAR
jgi:hypothetical protein